MPRTRSLAFSELKIGIISVGAIVLSGVLIIAVGGQAGCFWQQYKLVTKFTNVQGMKSGAVIRVAGKDIGKVTSVEFNGAMIEVKMALNKEVQPLVTSDSRASMGSLSLLGEPIIEISAAPGGTPLRDGSYIESSGGGNSLTELTSQAKTSLDQANKLVDDIRSGKGTIGKLLTDEEAYRNLNSLLLATNRVAAGLEGTKGSAGRFLNDPALYNEMQKSVADLNAAIAPLKDPRTPLGKLLNDEAMAKSMQNTVNSLESATNRLSQKDNTMGALLNDKQMYDRLNGMTERIDKIINTLQGTTGTAGALINDSKLYDNMNTTMKELQQLVADIRKDPKKYLNVRVSIF